MKNHGYNPDALSMTQASQVIGEIKRHPEKLQPTKKQAKFLRWKGFDPNDYTKETATKKIGSIFAQERANNG